MEPFDLSEWSRARVNIDYHVAFDANFYSVPYNLVHEAGRDPLDADHGRDPAQRHARGLAPAQPRTRARPSPIDEHRPKSHRAHLEWTPSRMVHWAETIGPHTARLFERIMNDKPHPEMGYRGCLGIIRLAGKVLPRPRGSGFRACVAHRRVPLQERRIDSEELAGPGAASFTATAGIHATARQHPRLRVLRIRRATCYRNR